MKPCQPTKTFSKEGQEEYVEYPDDALTQKFMLSLFKSSEIPSDVAEAMTEFIQIFNTKYEEPILFTFKKKDRSICFEGKDTHPKPNKRTAKPSKTNVAPKKTKKVESSEPLLKVVPEKISKNKSEAFEITQLKEEVHQNSFSLKGDEGKFLEIPPDSGLFKVSEQGEALLRKRLSAFIIDYDVDFKAVYNVNKALGLEEEFPIWYVLHPDLGNSFGPISTNQLEKLHKSGVIKWFYLIRLLDFITVRSQEPIFFSKLSDLENKDFLMSLTVSSLVQTEREEKFENQAEEILEEEIYIQPKKNKAGGSSNILSKPKNRKKAKAKEIAIDINYEEKANPYDF